MEIIIGAVLSVLTEVLKWGTKKFGKKVTDAVLYTFLFFVSLGWTFLVQKGVISQEMIQYWIGIVSSAVLTYELLLKRVEGVFSK